MKVFLSHSTKDKEFVQRLADALAGADFTPWLCEVDIEKNENFVAKIEEGLAQSDIVLMVWSPDAAISNWTTEEWTAVLARQVAEQKIRLGIVLLRDCLLPELLRTKNYIDARSDQGGALRETVAWLKRRKSVQRLSGLKAPVYLPDYRPRDFVGRKEYLERLHEMVTAEPGTFLLHGEPGTGKSMLALRFAWEAQKDFDAVLYQTCGARALDEIIAELADRLPIDVKTRPPEEKRKRSMQWLRERQSLLVLDDVWGRDLKQLEPGPPCSVLYTSRQPSLPWISEKQSIEVESFREEEAEQLFHAYLDTAFGEDEVTRCREALLGFAGKVEMLPIAVAVGASLLREKRASRLDRSALKLRLDDLNDGVRDVPQLFHKAITSQFEREQWLLAGAAVCIQEGFWLPLVARIANLSEDEADEAADRLMNSSLLRVLDREQRRFQLHALLREQVRASCSEEELYALREAHAVALEALFTDWGTQWSDCSQCLREIIPASNFLWDRKESGRMHWLSDRGLALANRIGELQEGLRILKQVEQLYARRTDRDAFDVLQSSYGNQAVILHTWGRLEEAMALLKKEEAVCVELGNDYGLQESYGGQAVILREWGRGEEAMALLKKQEAIGLELGDMQGLQISYGSQALSLKAWGRLEEAMALLKKQEGICLELGNQLGLHSSYGNQALILKAWGRLEEAMALHKKEEGICLELGNQQGLVGSYGNQAAILKEWGRLDEAMALLKKQEAICLKLDHKHGLGTAYGNQALILQEWGQPEEAMTLLKKHEAICLELSNKDGLQLSYGNQALILKEWGRLEEAMELLKREEAICVELGGKEGLGYCYWQWASLAGRQGDKQTERRKLKQALAIFTGLKMSRERDGVQAELDKTDTA